MGADITTSRELSHLTNMVTTCGLTSGIGRVQVGPTRYGRLSFAPPSREFNPFDEVFKSALSRLPLSHRPRLDWFKLRPTLEASAREPSSWTRNG